MGQNLFFVSGLKCSSTCAKPVNPEGDGLVAAPPGWGRAYTGVGKVGKGICRHARWARPQDFRLFSKSDTPLQHFLCSTGSGPDYNFINSGCSFYNAPQILAKGVGFSVANPQFLALSPHPLGGALLNEGEGRPTILIRRRRNIVNIGRRRLLGCFPFRCKYCEWELK